MTKTEKAVQWAVGIANDDSHGYSQTVRWGPSYDCSSLVISAWQEAGVPVKVAGATYTGNMYVIFKQNGFADVTALINLASGTGLVRGDVLLNHSDHTAMYIGNEQVVHARSSEGTSDTADNSGNEIRCQSYWNYPWNCVLRYGEEAEEPSIVIVEPTTDAALLVPYNTKGIGIAMLQGGLKYLGYNLGWFGIDGDNGGKGSYTNLALEQAVSHNEISKETINYLLKLN